MEKVKVRVAVVVDPKGKWYACGWAGAKDDKEMMDNAIDGVEPGESRYWLTAELELPEAPEIAATVERDQSS